MYCRPNNNGDADMTWKINNNRFNANRWAAVDADAQVRSFRTMAEALELATSTALLSGSVSLI